MGKIRQRPEGARRGDAVHKKAYPFIRANGQRAVPLGVAGLRASSLLLGLFSAQHPLVEQIPEEGSHQVMNYMTSRIERYRSVE